MVGGIDPRVRDRIVAETRGIPLAILEVPRSVSATELAGGFWISGKRPSAGRSRKASSGGSSPYRRRPNGCCSSLPPSPSATLRCSCAQRRSWAFRSTRWGLPRLRGVIEFGPRMRFHHPLMRSAVYRAADLDRTQGPYIGRWPTRPIRSRTPTVGHGTPPTPPPDPTTRWPRSWKPQQAGPRAGAVSPRRQHSSSARRH